MNRRTCLKLAKRIYGLFLIEAKISPVACKLRLPPSSSIYPVFHITLLKPFKGTAPDQISNPLPPLAMDSHPIICPSRVVAYRRIKHKGQSQTQALVEWVRLPEENRSREDIEFINRLLVDVNLEDKIKLDGSGDVTVELELGAVAAKLRDDLGLSSENDESIPAHPVNAIDCSRKS